MCCFAFLSLSLLCACCGHVGVASDHAEAARIWQRGVDAGDDRSAFNLAMCYSNGDGVGKDVERSMEMLQVAASRGNGRAKGLLQQILLDRMAKDGKADGGAGAAAAAPEKDGGSG